MRIWHSAVLILLPGCVALSGGGAGTPDWVRTRTHAAYPDSAYLVGFGTASEAAGLTRADDMARAELAKLISVQIRSEATSYAKEQATTTGTGTRRTGTESVASRLMARTSVRLEGVSIAERWRDPRKRVFHALAVLNRSAAVADTAPRAKAAAEAARELVAHARESEKAGDRAAALSAYRAALEKVVLFRALTVQLRAIGRARYVGPEPQTDETKIELASRALAEKMRFAVVAFQHFPGVELACPLAESGLVERLRAQGLTTAAVGDEVRSLGYGDLTRDISRARERLAGRAAYLLVARVRSEFAGTIQAYSRPVHNYRASGEGVLIDLDTGKVLCRTSFPAGEKTNSVAISHEAAARAAAEKGAPILVEMLARAVVEGVFGSKGAER